MDDALQALLEQERLLHFKRFDSEMAWRLGSALVEQAKREKLTLAVDISVVGHQVFHFACNGTSADNDAWLQRKAKTVLRFGHSSLYMGRKLAKDGVTASDRYFVSETEYCFHGGGFPIIVEGTGLVGAVVVSGLRQEEDHALVVAAIARLLHVKLDD
jgi:uncharacterized protein (UPF0303 family)